MSRYWSSDSNEPMLNQCCWVSSSNTNIPGIASQKGKLEALLVMIYTLYNDIIVNFGAGEYTQELIRIPK